VPVEKTSPSILEIFFETRAIRNPILSATATNPLLTKTLLSAMLKDPNDATDEKIKILQEPLVLEGATNTLGDWLGYVVNVQEVSLTTNPTHYQNLTMPTLIIWGDSDTVIPLKEGEYLASIIPNAELVVMKDVNHVPHVEDLDNLMPIVMEFLNQLKK
jgi:pimeloyl-ACP methyl ester carboxylesterase